MSTTKMTKEDAERIIAAELKKDKPDHDYINRIKKSVGLV